MLDALWRWRWVVSFVLASASEPSGLQIILRALRLALPIVNLGSCGTARSSIF